MDCIQDLDFDLNDTNEVMNEKEKEKEKEKEAMAKEKGKKKKPNANSKKKKDDDFEIEEDNDSEPEKNKNSILFREFVDVLLKIEKCKGLNSKDTVKETLCDFFIHIFEKYPQDFTKIYYFLSYKIGPTYLIPDLVILSDKLEEMVIRLFNLSDNSLKDNLKHYGDLGQVASDIKQTDEEMNAFHNYVDKKRKNLSIASIMTSLEEAALGDENSGDKSKIKIIYNLMVKTGKDEIKFLIRFLEKNLKLGISQSLLLSSISRAISRMYKNTNEADINKVLSKCKSQIDDEDIIFGYVIEMIKNKTDFKRLIDLCHIRCGVPFKYQLSDSTSGIKTMIKEVGKNSFTCENLYHGMRCQIHCNKNKIQIFNKSLEDITQKYPEIVGYSTIFITKSIEKNKKDIKSFILDCTFLPYDKKNDRALNVQELSFFTKEKVVMGQQQKPNNHICVFCFDVLFFNGQTLVSKTLRERKKILYSNFTETMSFRFAKHVEFEKTDKDEIDEFMNESLLIRCRGIMVKLLDTNSSYLVGEKNDGWKKINKNYYKADLDSLYFVIIGAKYGKGDRMRLYSSVLLACFNEDDESYEAIVFTNGTLKNRQLDELLFNLKDHIIGYQPNNYKFGKYEPDVIFAPRVVVQAKTFFLCLNQSAAVAYNVVHENFGISIRFPKILKLRDDKKIQQISTTKRILSMYNAQDTVKNNETEYDQSEYTKGKEA